MYEESPLDRIQCDLIKIDENLKSDDARYNYIFTAVCHHSKKAWAKCLRNKNAESVGRIIGKLFDKIFACFKFVTMNNNFKKQLNCFNPNG